MNEFDSTAGQLDRHHWASFADRLARPILTALSSQKLRAAMPVEQHLGANRQECSHLEAIGRLLAGLSPWLQTRGPDAPVELAALARESIKVAVDPASPDFLNFCTSPQALVDAAFLAQAILRAPDLLWNQLDDRTRRNLIEAMKSSRAIKPPENNWLLFSAAVEAFLAMAGERWEPSRVDYAISRHLGWYKGDSAYGDGPSFHWDYYNSFVIQPMLLDVLAGTSKHDSRWNDMRERIQQRAARYAIVQERLIAPDGSFPPIGRSLAYRCGAFHLLAQLALQKKLPAELKPAQVRTAVTAVIRRTLGAHGTFDAAGWLRIGLCGEQLDIAEGYISTGSLYLCSTAFLPLGLESQDEFWTAAPLAYTSQKVWSGQPVPADHAMQD